MWAAFCLEFFFGLPLSSYGIYPRSLGGLVGIIMAPLLHGNLQHILSNTVPMLFLGTVLFYFYRKIALEVFVFSYVGTGGMVWLVARGAGSHHIGASGVVYALAAFLVFYGLFRKKFLPLIISTIIVLMYGGLVFGVLPGVPGVSWESHLFGALMGAFLGYWYARKPMEEE